MTRLLVSVRSAGEAAIALQGGADIVDVKEPRAGVLGAAPHGVTRAIVNAVAGRRPVSATVGDVPLDQAAAAALATAETGVDYVKIGAFAGGAGEIDLAPFERLAARGLRLILVMFADCAPDFGLIRRLGEAGFAGVMLDTAAKGKGGLRTHLSEPALASFIAGASAAHLLAGLAGSLSAADIAPLMALGPDVLGFRGAVCKGGARQENLDLPALSALRRLIPREASGTGAENQEHDKLFVGEA